MQAAHCEQQAPGTEPHVKPHNVQCACCPRTITLLTRTYVLHTGGVDLGARDEFLEGHSHFGLSSYYEFVRGMLLRVHCLQGQAALITHVLKRRESPHNRDCYVLPDFGLVPGDVIWVCPRCKGVFKGNRYNVERYLAERQWSFNHAGGVTFELSNNTEA